MRTTGTFTVETFTPADYESPITTALPIGHAHMAKAFTGGVTGRAATQFSAAFDPASGKGTYVALEAFEGTVDGRAGSFAFAHSASTDGQSTERLAEMLVVVPGSGTSELAGITGTGRITIDEAGTHALILDYALSRD